MGTCGISHCPVVKYCFETKNEEKENEFNISEHSDNIFSSNQSFEKSERIILNYPRSGNNFIPNYFFSISKNDYKKGFKNISKNNTPEAEEENKNIIYDTKVYPKLDELVLDEEKEKLIKNKIGSINFKNLFMESLSEEFLNLFKNNENLYHSKLFLEGICTEYGLMGRNKDIAKAFQIYKKGADSEYDYLCMYRMHRIYIDDYKKFNLIRNFELDRLYLYKSFAYCPYDIIKGKYYIFNKINIIDELSFYFEYLDDNKFTTISKFFLFLRKNYNKFNITLNDIQLIEYVISSIFKLKEAYGIEVSESFLTIKKENKNDKAYYESQLKYCNFYIECSKENCDKNRVNKIFDKLINSEYYKAAYDYGQFLLKEGKFEEIFLN